MRPVSFTEKGHARESLGEKPTFGMLKEIDDVSIVLTLTLFFVLLALTAFFSVAEMALIAARPSGLEAAGASIAAETVLALKKRPGLFLAAIRAGDLATDLLIGAFVVTALDHLAGEALRSIPVIGNYASILAGIGAFVVVSYVSLVFADLAPKSVALSSPEKSALLVAYPLKVLIFLARPFLAILEGSNSLILKTLCVRQQREETVTQEEIRRVLAAGLSAGALVPFEQSMMERILDLDHRSVRTVMTGRPYIQWLRAGMDAQELSAAVLQATASRLLVAGGDNLEKLLGVVSRADVLAALAQGEPVDLGKLATAPAYISENTSVLGVLETLKALSVHMVIVVDEFGSLIGLATLADVLEAVAGELTIRDGAKSQAPSSELTPELDGSYLIAASQPVDDVAEVIALTEPINRRYKTMAGLVIDHLRRIPREGEALNLPALRIEVVSVEQGTIAKLRLVPRWNRNPRSWTPDWSDI